MIYTTRALIRKVPVPDYRFPVPDEASSKPDGLIKFLKEYPENALKIPVVDILRTADQESAIWVLARACAQDYTQLLLDYGVQCLEHTLTLVWGMRNEGYSLAQTNNTLKAVKRGDADELAKHVIDVKKAFRKRPVGVPTVGWRCLFAVNSLLTVAIERYRKAEYVHTSVEYSAWVDGHKDALYKWQVAKLASMIS